MIKIWTSIIFQFLCSGVIAQCNWNAVVYDSYELLTPIPDILPGVTYGTTSQTYPGCTRTGSRGMYLNIVNGYSGPIYDRTFTNICTEAQYTFSFSTRDAFSSTNNFNVNVYDGNNILIQTLNVINNAVWQDIVMPPFTVTTNTIRFQIVTNLAGMSGNDIGFDDLRLNQCQPELIQNTIQECGDGNPVNLFSLIPSNPYSANGQWTGPSILTNGYLGTYTPGTNMNGLYIYSIDGTLGCPDSIAQLNVSFANATQINGPNLIQGCETVNVPVITGVSLVNPTYYTLPNQGGSIVAVGTALTSSQTLYSYSGYPGCSDEEIVTITIFDKYLAGTDNSFSVCSDAGNFDLSVLLDNTASPNGSWEEISAVPSGAFNNGILNSTGLPPNFYTFNYIVPSNGTCLGDTAELSFYSGASLSVNLGPDTSFCQGQSCVLSPGIFDYYLWDNNSSAPTRTVSTPGTYFVTVGIEGSNLIYNGDFELGSNGFTTSYIPGTGGSWGLLSNAGTYAVTTSPNLVHSNFVNCTDHTESPGTNMMVVNGSGTPNTNVWCQTVNVQPFTDYQFSVWVSSVVNDINVAQLQFNINNSILGDIFSPSSTGCNWAQFAETWNSGIETSAQICIVNQNTSEGGNDFAIDDIHFSTVCYATDSIVVSNYPSPIITASPNDTICQGDVSSIIASSSMPNLTYTWNPGNIVSPDLNVSPATSTVYTVVATSPEGCISNAVSRVILVRPTPIASIAINGNDTICLGQSVVLNGTANIASTYSWSSSSNTTTVETVSPLTTTQYTLTAASVSYSCVDDTTITIYVVQPLSVDISGNTNICQGETTTLSASGNQAQMEYTWTPSGSSSNSQIFGVNDAGWIYLTGDYFFCPQAIDSVLLEILPNPVVVAPQDVVICPGELVTLVATVDQSSSVILWQPNGVTGASQNFSVLQTTQYVVYAQNGACISEPDTVSIIVGGACDLNIPNVFTPNGDDANDYFQLINYNGLKDLSCIILNRWGNVIKTFDAPDFKWDGMDKNGVMVTEGVYFYKITATSMSDELFEKTGFVELKLD